MNNSFENFAKGRFKPTDDQKILIQKLDNFFEDDCKCFIIKGYAGTGKTYFVKWLSEYLSYQGYDRQLMAPTGRASLILGNKTGVNATTLHKGIYSIDNLSEIVVSKSGKIKYKFMYEIRRSESPTRKFFIVDESSMISDKFSDNDFFMFGSGRVLTDLIDYSGLKNLDKKDKLIFVGDPAQLPPVSDSISGALSRDYLKEAYDLNSMEYEMKEVVRQKEGSKILFNATYIRNLLQNPSRNNFVFENNKTDFKKIEEIDVVEEYLKTSKFEVDDSVIINFSNKQALEYNLAIRERLFKDKFTVEAGDKLIIAQNNYNYEIELYNGMIVRVLEAEKTLLEKKRLISYDYNGKDCKIDLSFRKVIIETDSIVGKKKIQCLILDDFIYDSSPTLSYEKNIAIYLDFKIRNPKLKPGTKEFRETLRKDPFFNVLRVKYAYSITCHKAQGGEWNTVFVNMDISAGKLTEIFLRWTYTAITRARENVILFNYNSKTIFSDLEFGFAQIPLKTTQQTFSSQITFTLPENFKDTIVSFGLTEEEPVLISKLKEVLAIANHLNANVIKREKKDFQEIYMFESGSRNAGISFWYNGKKVFTKVTSFVPLTNSTDFASELISLFSSSIEIIIKSDEDDIIQEGENNFSDNLADPIFENNETLHLLYSELKDFLMEFDIRISNIKHFQFLEKYELKREDEIAFLNFYYNGSGSFTKCIPDVDKCNSMPLLEDISKCIERLKSS